MAKASATPGRVEVPAQSNGQQSSRRILLAGVVIVLAALAVYANTFSSPFIFDDLKAITGNPSIRHLWPLSDVLSPPGDVTGAVGRPMVNLSLAVNYAIGGLDVRGYHIFNALIHALAGLTLLGIVRRTLLRPLLRERFGGMALPLAFVVALLWVLHPLQTESVTCVIQRSESLMGLFYLLTLYGFVRSVESPAPRPWRIFTFIACLLGMATKEVMISAPLLVLIYDRTFVAGTFRSAWQQRGRFHVGLAATGILLIWLNAHSGQRAGAAGFGLGVSSWDYALTQCRAIILYLRLSVWPHPLIVDRGTAVVHSMGEVWLQGVILVALVAGTLFALWRKPVIGFLGCWFFAILAPSSSVVPLISQTIAEHRMYLSLAAVIVLLVAGGYAWLGQRVVLVGVALSVVAGWATVLRNADFRDPLTLWGVTVAQQPDNARAQMNLGTALLAADRPEEARQHFAAAAEISPNFAEAYYSLASVLLQLGRPLEAIAPVEKALQVKPDYAEAHYVLGTLRLKQKQVDAAIEQYQAALRIRPDFVDVEHTLAGTLAIAGRTAEAVEHYETALRLQPENAMLHVEIGNVLVRLGRTDEALQHLQLAERLDSSSPTMHYSLGNVLFGRKRFAEAASHFEAVVRLLPKAPQAHNNLGNALVQLGRLEEAQAQFEEALRLNPDYATARENLERLRAIRANRAAH